jgi:hypothetical protein
MKGRMKAYDRNLVTNLYSGDRFLDITLTNRHNITSGKIYKEVIYISIKQHFISYKLNIELLLLNRLLREKDEGII